MTEQFTKKEDIENVIIILKKYSKEDFKFTDHYWPRITERQIEHDFLIKTFFEFDKLKLIEKEFLKEDYGYDLFYEISKNKTLIIGVIPKENILLFTHGILRYRKWQSAIKQRK